MADNPAMALQCSGLVGREPLKITFSLPGRGRMKLFLTDMTGRIRAVLREGVPVRGVHEAVIPAEKFPGVSIWWCLSLITAEKQSKSSAPDAFLVLQDAVGKEEAVSDI